MGYTEERYGMLYAVPIKNKKRDKVKRAICGDYAKRDEKNLEINRL